MSTVVLVSSGGRILDHALLALVRSLRPEWSVDLTVDPYRDRPAILTLRLAGSDRWMAVVCGADDGSLVASALANGAIAVVPIDAELDHFETALDALVYGDSPYLPARVAKLLAEGVLSQTASPPAPDGLVARLTRRESEVLGLVAQGLSNQEIAARLGLSVNTVRTHLQSLTVKLHATSRAKMVANAWESGLYLAPESPGPRRPTGSVAS